MNSYDDLKSAVDVSFAESEGVVQACEKALIDLNRWVSANLDMHKEQPGALLLTGALSSAVEIMATVRLGLLRQAIFVSRNYYELILAWIYYKDHGVEWAKVESCKDQMMLPGEVKKYLRKSLPNYEVRWGVLANCKRRKSEDPYDLMSAVVHGSVSTALPNANYPKDIVADIQTLRAIVGFLIDLAEYISDVLVSSFESNWDSLPDCTRKAIVNRLPKMAPEKLLLG